MATILDTSPVTGMGMDVGAISKAIRDVAPDCLIIVDGIQHAAHGQIDIAGHDVDGYVISPYKMFSRHGYGLAWISDRMTAMEHDSLVGGPEGNWSLARVTPEPMPRCRTSPTIWNGSARRSPTAPTGGTASAAGAAIHRMQNR